MGYFPAATKVFVVSIISTACWTESFTAVPNTKFTLQQQQHQNQWKGISIGKKSNTFQRVKTSIRSSESTSSSIVEKIEDPILKKVDDVIVGPIVRVANHIPALLSLSYFGLVSMVSMMSSSAMMEAPLLQKATLSSVLARVVGKTSNAEFATLFPTLVTPSNPVFLIWPVIAATQLITLGVSAFLAAVGRGEKPPLFDQDDLTALSLSNLAATAWIIISSQSSKDMLPLGSLLVLPIVPLVSGYQLRRKKNQTTNSNGSTLVFQLFSSFTTIASLLALTVELQHGQRFPLFTNRPELSALVFLLGYFGIVSREGKNGLVKRVVNTVAIGGILAKRISDAAGANGVFGLFRSVSFWITGGIAAMATKQLFGGDD
mmetsp:Transcript_8750/g.15897  ORF Transcript_8750/g.15897 Transcript_8750/m.15897 type:complete len:374 (-) Transcript_8750:1416-2537(-)|eukprot:CAMPEP_0201866758 /NCGR_PEP_ID=MMETSP0902-20130614/1229_1 /ASSEMBLY_ACC=CAM_ASM_000551 /TAXON_ID=420261 /ORGANISM="Thalassiosira antarctica, Strain CCMP982" /LENGTH=373 /DNA_ID=CAMNT_0048391787 /DNA_START=99 /DNA_END=1220 /DNA_ORIENTATION=-